jgi:hypothetical protein
VKLQQVKTDCGVSRVGGREGKRASDQWSERWNFGQIWKLRGLEKAFSEKGHLSIFSRINQYNQKAVNHLG